MTVDERGLDAEGGRRRSLGRRLLGPIVLIVVGAGLFAASMISGLTSIAGGVTALDRVVVPGAITVEIDTPGEYTVFLESTSHVAGTTYHADPATPTPVCTLVDTDGTELGMLGPAMSMRYDLDRYVGDAVGRFTVTRPGTYTFRAAPGASAPSTPFVVAFGDLALGSSILRLIVGGCFGALIAVLGLTALVVVIARHASAR